MPLRPALPFLLYFGTSCATFAADVSPPSVRADLARLGPRQEVARLTAGSGRDWEKVLLGVQSGQQAWLDLVTELKAGADAGPGEALRSSFAAALLRNPAAVLKLTPAAYPVAEICAVPLIEPTDEQVADYRRRVLAALGRIPAADRPDPVDECRQAILKD